jgi:hypothetical protein
VSEFEVDDATRIILDRLSVSSIVEYLFGRLGIVRGELRLTAKEGRYDRGKKVVPLGDD